VLVGRGYLHFHTVIEIDEKSRVDLYSSVVRLRAR
jgi:hypothetical protein